MRVIDMNGDSRRTAPRKADGRTTAKEEAEKKEIPPSPPIGRKGEEEREHKKGERVRAPSRDACTRGPLAETPPDGVINHRIPPTLGVALWHAHHNIGFHDDAFVAEWYDDMVAAFWCDREGRPIRNWGYRLNKWIRNRDYFAALRDAPETNNRRDAYRHIKRPDNWVGMDDAAREDFLRGIQ